MKIAVAFLCYNQSSAPYLPDFLASLEDALVALEGDVLVLAGDNSDQPPFVNNLLLGAHNQRAQFPVRLLSFENNLGFAAAYNRLISLADEEGADYFLMLNPDMLLTADAVVKLVAALEIDNKLAAVCPKIYRWNFAERRLTNIIDSCGIMMKAGLRFYDLGQGREDDGHYDRAHIFGPSGAAACFRLSSLKKIKFHDQYFDERFFMYKEDCDLAYRLNRAGLTTALVPNALVYHDRSLAAESNLFKTWQDWRRRSPLTRSWSFVNQHLIFIKYWSIEPWKSRILILFQVIYFAFFSLIFANFLLKDYQKIKYLRNSID